MVTALQTMVTRRFDVFDPVVVTVGTFHAGTQSNIIPDDAVFEATVRTFSPQAAERMRVEAVRICEGIAAAHGLAVDSHYETEYPVTVNDPAAYDFVADTVLEHGRIIDVGTDLDGDEAVDCTGTTVLPGLFDCHVHVTVSDIGLVSRVQKPFSYQFYEAARNLWATLGLGITTVRDAAG